MMSPAIWAACLAVYAIVTIPLMLVAYAFQPPQHSKAGAVFAAAIWPLWGVLLALIVPAALREAARKAEDGKADAPTPAGGGEP